MKKLKAIMFVVLFIICSPIILIATIIYTFLYMKLDKEGIND